MSKATCIHIETAFNFRISPDAVENLGDPAKKPQRTGRLKRGQVTILVIRRLGGEKPGENQTEELIRVPQSPPLRAHASQRASDICFRIEIFRFSRVNFGLLSTL